MMGHKERAFPLLTRVWLDASVIDYNSEMPYGPRNVFAGAFCWVAPARAQRSLDARRNAGGCCR
jgi:hypothetical protein